MKWMMLVLCLVLLDSCSALSVDERTHTVFYGDSIRIVLPLSKLLIEDYVSNQSSALKIKVINRLSSLSVDSALHSVNDNGFKVNVSNSTFVRLVSNTSKLYASFIESLNISLSVVVGENSLDDELMERFSIGIVNGFLKYKDKTGYYPFNGAIISTNVTGNRAIFVYGNAVEGEVSALRYLKKNKDEFLHFDSSYYLNDIDGLSVYDYMHTIENQKWYNTNTKEFRSIVNKSLFGKINETIIDVRTNDGVMLRVLEVKPLNSAKLNNFRNNITLPLVFARGLWANLYAWQSFGAEMADNGRKVYLIEITGGPGQDCSLCVNYDYSDLIESYWPALIGTVQTLNNNTQIQYVGHSNGARTGISSLEIYNDVGKQNAGFYFDNNTWINVSMTPHPVETYIAAGMPGAFEGEQSLFGEIVKDNYDKILTNLNNKNETHKTFGTAFESYREKLGILFPGGDVISLNLLKDYFSWIRYENDTQPQTPNIPKLVIITGTKFTSDDGIVNVEDNNKLFNNSKASETHQYYIYTLHTSMGENGQIQNIIKYEITNENISWYRNMWGISYRGR